MNNIFNGFLPKAIFLSLTIHTTIVLSGYLWQYPKQKISKRLKQVEIQYSPQIKKAVDVSERPVKPAQQLDLQSSSMLTQGSGVPIKLAKQQQKLPGDFSVYERKNKQIRSTPMTHKISVTPMRSEKIDNPAYAAFSEMVRNRIREQVYANYRKMEAGSVYLTFVIASDGALKAAKIIEEKTNATYNLKNISIKSLQESQFPPFLKGMNLPEYTFNIEIQFQIRD